MRRLAVLFLVLAALAILVSCDQRPTPPAGAGGGGPVWGPAAVGIDELARLDLLPRLRSSVKTGMVSSYDRTGGNDDGFSGRFSFLRQEPAGLVIADLEGPGAIYRIHTPTPTDDAIEFYFDGAETPGLTLKVIELFDGTRPPFVAPLVGSGVGGYTSYLPITYRRSCKVVIKAASFQFYDLNYAVFPAGAEVATFTDPPDEAFMARVRKAGEIVGRAGTDIGPALVPSGTALRTQRTRARLEPGGRAVIFESAKPGRVVGLRLGPAAAFAGAGRDILVRAYWDGAAAPAVDCPAGDLFGYSFGEPAARSLMLGTTPEGVAYFHFPMPFGRSARIELVSERAAGSPTLDLVAEVVAADIGKAADEGRFYARWRRENPCAEGRPYTYLRTTGRGHVVGVMLQAQGLESGQTGFFEGDDRAVIDGELAVPGTGSEDSFNGGWYDVPGRWETRTSLPLSGCLDYKKPLGRTGGYRFMLTDAYAYRESIDYTIEHGPEGNAVPADYASVVFFYSQEPPPAGEPMRPAAERRVTPPRRVVFAPGWNVPIHTMSIQNAAWTKEVSAFGKDRVRHFALRTSGGDIFGPHHVSFICDLPAAGTYAVSVKAVTGPDQGIVQVYQRDRPAGDAVNLYAPERAIAGPMPLGTFEMEKGPNILYLYLVGSDPRAIGGNMDLLEIVFEAVVIDPSNGPEK